MKKRRQDLKAILARIGIVKDFELTMTNNGHFNIESKHLKRQIRTSGTPSDIRAALNIASEIKNNLVEGFIPVKQYYSKEEKQVLIDLCEQEKIHPEQVAKDYGVGFSTLKKWIFKDRENRGLPTSSRKSAKTLDNNPKYKAYIFDTNQGLSVIEASKKHGITVGKGYEWVNREKSKRTNHISSGKVIKRTEGERNKSDFIGALDTLKQLVDELEQARDTIALLEAENLAYKDKFALLVEATTI